MRVNGIDSFIRNEVSFQLSDPTTIQLIIEEFHSNMESLSSITLVEFIIPPIQLVASSPFEDEIQQEDLSELDIVLTTEILNLITRMDNLHSVFFYGHIPQWFINWSNHHQFQFTSVNRVIIEFLVANIFFEAERHFPNAYILHIVVASHVPQIRPLQQLNYKYL